MKNIISITLLFFYVLLFATGPIRFYTGQGCVDNLGHMFYTPDSIWSDTSKHWYVDTFVIRANPGAINDTTFYSVNLVMPAGRDTVYFKCLKCDSIGYYVSDSTKIFQRTYTEIK
jgi:hypothetical protein